MADGTRVMGEGRWWMKPVMVPSFVGLRALLMSRTMLMADYATILADFPSTRQRNLAMVSLLPDPRNKEGGGYPRSTWGFLNHLSQQPIHMYLLFPATSFR